MRLPHSDVHVQIIKISKHRTKVEFILHKDTHKLNLMQNANFLDNLASRINYNNEHLCAAINMVKHGTLGTFLIF